MGKNVIIFSADMSPSVHVNGRNMNILVIGEGPTHGLQKPTVTAGAKYSINFTKSGKKCFKCAL